MKKSLLLVLVLFSWVARAQQTLVPDNVYFAGMHLKVTRAAREELQKHVDLLLKNPNYVQMKVERADLYFPIVQRVFQEEGLPEDFKYLALQESGLVSDAVSTSNAVGFWQFKKEAASDMGLLINSNVDERKHIVASSRGAARYLLKHNTYFKNWVTTLLSYNLGFTGAKNVTKTSEIGVTEAEIDKGTHNYIMTFLAHKIAFENLVGKNRAPKQNLRELPVTAGQSLLDVAKAANIDVAELERYNKWLSSTTVPADKAYVMLMPVSGSEQIVLEGAAPLPAPATLIGPVAPTPLSYSKLNGLKVVQARNGDTKERLALQSGLSIKQFLKFNDLYGFDAIEEGQFYYVEAKHTRSEAAEFHVAAPGENLQKISQKYGVKVKALRSHNRMGKGEVVVAGRVIWLRNTRPRTTPVEYHNVPEPVTAVAVAPQPATIESVPTLIVEIPAAPAAEAAVETVAPAAPAAVTQTAAELVTTTETTAPAPSKNLLTKPETVKAEIVKPETTKTPDAPAAAMAITESAPAAVATHSVARGESLFSIAKKYATTIDNLKAWNELNSSALSVGQKLKVQAPEGFVAPVETPAVKAAVTPTTAPAPVVIPAQTTKSSAVSPAIAPAGKAIEAPVASTSAPAVSAETHTVAKGESLYLIARKYSCSVVELMDWNGKTDPALKIGEVLKVKKPAVIE